MPNWCFQGLQIGGPIRDRRLLLEKWEVTEDRRFANWFPCPKDLPGTTEYDWCLEHWGTKWGDCDTELNNSGSAKELTGFHFKSAWSPADKLIMNVSRRFPKLVFGLSYTEESDFFAGYVIIRNGRLLEEQEYGTEIPKNVLEDMEDGGGDLYSEWRCDLECQVSDDCAATVKEYEKQRIDDD